MIVTTIQMVDGQTYTGRSPSLLTADEIREWEQDITWDTQTITALDESSGRTFTWVDGQWLSDR